MKYACVVGNAAIIDFVPSGQSILRDLICAFEPPHLYYTIYPTVAGLREHIYDWMVVLKLALEVESYKKTYVSVVQLIMLPTKRLMGTCNWHLGKA